MALADPVRRLATTPEDEGMIRLEGGLFRMGSERFYPEEQPVHRVRVDPFLVDRTPVTNAQFARFVEATGYVTFAEIPPRAEDYPGALADMLHPGSLVFVQPSGPVPMQLDHWWRFVLGADWRHPTGPDSDLDGLDEHPVVHVTASDCPPKPSGSLPHAGASIMRSTPGATSASPQATSWPTTGKDVFPTRTPPRTASSGPRRSARFPRTGTVWST
jgi:hypothetical protein